MLSFGAVIILKNSKNTSDIKVITLSRKLLTYNESLLDFNHLLGIKQ